MTGAASASSSPPRERADAGFVLVAVLWILAALATSIAIYSSYAVNSAISSHLWDDRLQAEASIRAGVEMTAFQQLALPVSGRPQRGGLALQVGRTTVAVRYVSEAARIDLNAAPADLLTGLFAALGVDSDRSADYANRLIAWRTKPQADKDSGSLNNGSVLGNAQPLRQAPFDNVLELTLVPGLPRPVAERILPYVTIFSGRAEVDVVSADPTVLAALPGVTPEIVKAVVAARAKAPDDRAALLSLLGAARGRVAQDPSKTFRADMDVRFANGRLVRAEVVFRMNETGDEPCDILFWRDDFDGPAPFV
jgi:general secretion pathway protein K